MHVCIRGVLGNILAAAIRVLEGAVLTEVMWGWQFSVASGYSKSGREGQRPSGLVGG